VSSFENVHFFVEIDSTNRWMRDEAARGAVQHGAIAVADLQTAGRGRLDRKWVAPPKSALLMSVLVDSSTIHLPIERWPLVSLCMALAVEEAANEAVGIRRDEPRPVVLKWPNDVIVVDPEAMNPLGYRKLAGILVEVTSGRLVVGVGVNLQRPAELDPELPSTARPIWLSELTNRVIDRDEFAKSVVARFFALVEMLIRDTADVLEAYRPVLATIGWTVRIESQGREWDARAVDVDEQGRLVVVNDDGVHHLDVSEVVHVRPTA
jgi:BirA family transcriptional regulator, biotin operon repressor / biotin---[acetyl-CoA-carboxylase] ligase